MSIAHWRAPGLSRLPSFRFEQRISGQGQTRRKRELNWRVQQELLNRVYDSMFHFVRLPNAIITTVRTKPNVATIGCKKGTGLKSTGAGRLGRRLPYRKCSTRCRSRKTIGLPYGATSRKVGIGCADPMVPGHVRHRGGEESCECQLWDSYFLSVPRRTLVRDVLSDARSRTHRKLHQMPSKNPATIAEHRGCR
jgi:hypothetical protein